MGKKTKYTLPDSWQLKVSEDNRKIVDYWRMNVIKYDTTNGIYGYPYIYSDGSGGAGYIKSTISTEEFIEYVLGRDVYNSITAPEDLSYLISMIEKINEG